MAQYYQVLWSEGLFATQHHFQQHDVYYDRDIAFRGQALRPFAYGVTHLAIDADAIENRLFALQEFEGILPDGTAVRIPQVDDPPPSRSLEEAFGPTESSLGVYLALPTARRGSPLVRMGGEGKAIQTRYACEYVTLPDTVTGEGEREIGYAKKQLQILFSSEELNEYDCLKIAEIVRNPEGGMALNHRFVPSSLALGASTFLRNFVKGLLEVCSAKSDSLSDRVRQRTPQMAEFTGSDMPNFILLHTINRAIPLLAHFHQHPHYHPADVFSALASFAGALCTFSNEMKAQDIPLYNHTDLTDCFADLENQLRVLLDMVVAAKYVKIPLTEKQPTLYEGSIADPDLLTTRSFYLGVSADIEETKLISDFPIHGKIISPDKIDLLIAKNLPGVGITYMAHPPAALPIKAGLAYFRLDATGDRWEFIKNSNAISIYGPPQLFPGLKLELMAIKE